MTKAKGIEITIKPTLGNLMLDDRRWSAQLVIFMNAIEELSKRLSKYVDAIQAFFKHRDWRQIALEDVGEKILEYAKDNAQRGYEGTEAIRQYGKLWQQRADITQRLYRLRGYDPVGSGLTTGVAFASGDGDENFTSANRLIDSFDIGHALNVFIVNPDLGIVVVGTKFKWARTLEEGGIKTGGHLGIRDDWIPAKWLIEALQIKENLSYEEAWQEAFKIRDELVELGTMQGIPERPFLKPALYFVKDQDDALDIIARQIGYYLNRLLTSEMPVWSKMLDSFKVEYIYTN